MLHIAICDDNQQNRNEIDRLLGKAIFARTDAEVDYYSDGRQIIEAINQNHFSYDLLLLDIHMLQVDGIRTAEYIRQQNIDVDIIFITISQNHVYEGYTYKAFAYLLKPLDEERVIREINRYLDEKERTEKYLNIPGRGSVNRVPISQICYFESDARKILVHMKQQVLEFYGKLDEVEQALAGGQFVRCHQSYLINKKYVTSVSRNGVQIEGILIPVSRKYQDIFKNMM